MPLFIDRNELADATAADLAAAHLRDLEVQDEFGVRFVTYWFDAGPVVVKGFDEPMGHFEVGWRS
jgi:hypothetical protein